MANTNDGDVARTVASNSTAKKISRNAESAVNSICRILNILGIAVLIAMTFLTVFDVIGRLFKRPIIGATEITEFMMVMIVFLCLGWSAIKGKMITVDLFTMRLPSRVQAILNSFTLFIGMGVIAVIAWRSLLETLGVQKDGVTTLVLKIPSYPFMWILTIGFGVLCLTMLMLLIQNILKAMNR